MGFEEKVRCREVLVITIVLVILVAIGIDYLMTIRTGSSMKLNEIYVLNADQYIEKMSNVISMGYYFNLNTINGIKPKHRFSHIIVPYDLFSTIINDIKQCYTLQFMPSYFYNLRYDTLDAMMRMSSKNGPLSRSTIFDLSMYNNSGEYLIFLINETTQTYDVMMDTVITYQERML